MERVIKALQQQPEVVDEVAELLFGDGAWEIAKALTKEKKDKILHNTAVGTNMVGSVAGPAALYSAVKHRKEGGIPRDIGGSLAGKMQGSKSRPVKIAGNKMKRVATSLNNPAGRKAKIAAGAAGAGLVGLQAINWSGDVISTKLLKDQNKKKVAKSHDGVREHFLTPLETVHKRKGGLEPMQGQDAKDTPKQRLVRAGVNGGFSAAKKAPSTAAKAKVATGKFVPVKSNPTFAEGFSNSEANSGVRSGKAVADKIRKADDVEVKCEISKVDPDKRQVFGWASVIEIGGEPVIDLQGDVMDLETIEKAAYDYVRNSRKGGNQHQRDGSDPVHVSDMVESFVITKEKKEQMGLPDDLPIGWWVGFQVNDDDTWQQVKNGDKKYFSIHGSGTRKSVEV